MNKEKKKRTRTGNFTDLNYLNYKSLVGGVGAVTNLTDFSAAFFLPLLSRERDEYC